MFILSLNNIKKYFVSANQNCYHCVKSVPRRSFFWSIFSSIRTSKNCIWTLFTQCMWKYETAKEVIRNFKCFKLFRSSRPEVFCKKGVLGNATCNFVKKETLAQVFSCEFCEISKNTFFHRTPLMAASGISILQHY